MKRRRYLLEFHANMKEGIAYYRSLPAKAGQEWSSMKSLLQEGLGAAEKKLDEALAQFIIQSPG